MNRYELHEQARGAIKSSLVLTFYDETTQCAQERVAQWSALRPYKPWLTLFQDHENGQYTMLSVLQSDIGDGAIKRR
jgi:hypothetical protein